MGFWKQAEEAGKWEVQQNQILSQYQREFPGKIRIIQDETTLKDPKHFKGWKKKKGYN